MNSRGTAAPAWRLGGPPSARPWKPPVASPQTDTQEESKTNQAKKVGDASSRNFSTTARDCTTIAAEGAFDQLTITDARLTEPSKQNAEAKSKKVWIANDAVQAWTTSITDVNRSRPYHRFLPNIEHGRRVQDRNGQT